MKLTVTCLVFCLWLGTVLSFTTRYDGYQLLELTISTPLQAQRLRHTEIQDNLRVWWLAHKAHVIVSPSYSDIFTSFMEDTDIQYTVIQEDVQKHIDESMEMIARRRHESGTFDYDYNDYNDFETTMEELEQLADDCPDGITCETIDLGWSYEGRPLKQLRIGTGDRQAYWLDATMHCDEWIAPATVMRIADTLVRAYDTNADAQRLVDTYDWYIIPVWNPDGYTYTWTDDRLWLKTMSPNEGSECVGSNMNRNFDYLWGGDGTSSDPCSNNYPGAVAASEVETQTYQDELNRVAELLEGLVTYHAPGNAFLHPWSHTVDGEEECAYAEDHDDMLAVATAATDAIGETHGTSWRPGSWCDLLGFSATGVSLDYVKAVAGVDYSYSTDVRGDSKDPPPSEIQPAYEEMWNGLVAMVEAIEARKAL